MCSLPNRPPPRPSVLQDTVSGKPTGFLADSEETYAEKLSQIFSSSDEELMEIRRAARDASCKFDDAEFASTFKELFLSAAL